MSNRIENRPSTRKTIENARKSFESVTGKTVKAATAADIEQWLGSLRELGRSASTCRTYLSFVKQLTGLDAEMPAAIRGAKRVSIKRTLSKDESAKMLSAAPARDYALIAGLILCGADVLTYTWRDVADLFSEISTDAKLVLIAEAGRRGHDTRIFHTYATEAHYVNAPDLDEIIFPQTQHEVNRKLKSAARKAGIGDANINLTAMKNTWRKAPLSASRTSPQIGKRDLEGESAGRKKRDPRLHGIGRRGGFTIPA